MAVVIILALAFSAPGFDWNKWPVLLLLIAVALAGIALGVLITEGFVLRALRVLGIVIVSLLLVGFAAACSSTAPGRDLTQTDSSPSPSLTPSLHVRDLLSPPPDAFQVEFKWTETREGAEAGTFVLRHRGARDRWDWLDTDGGRTGAIDISDGHSTLSCLWYATTSPGELTSSCDVTHTAARGSNALQLALDARVTKMLGSRTIAGYDASCYAFSNLDRSEGGICVEPTLHVLLCLSGRTGITSNVEEVVEARSVSKTPSYMGDATSDAALLASHEPGHSMVVSRVALGLPPEFKIGK